MKALAAVIILVFINSFFVKGQASQEVLDSLLNIMGRDGIFYGQYVGHSHQTMPQFKAFESFVKMTSTDQKIECLKSKNLAIQAYSFWGLTLTDSLRASTAIRHIKRKKKKLECAFYGDVIYTYKLEILLNTFLLKPKSFYEN